MSEQQLAPHQQRVLDEHELNLNNLTKLIDFQATAIFQNLPKDEILRLNRQAMIMRLYVQVLSERFAAF
jgi:hypothetical protein